MGTIDTPNGDRIEGYFYIKIVTVKYNTVAFFFSKYTFISARDTQFLLVFDAPTCVIKMLPDQSHNFIFLTPECVYIYIYG